MEKIQTARVFINNNIDRYDSSISTLKVEEMLVEFTKLHVEAALKAAAEKVITKGIYAPSCDDHTPYWGPCVSCGRRDNPDVLIGEEVDKESILNAYPLSNIQ